MGRLERRKGETHSDKRFNLQQLIMLFLLAIISLIFSSFIFISRNVDFSHHHLSEQEKSRLRKNHLIQEERVELYLKSHKKPQYPNQVVFPHHINSARKNQGKLIEFTVSHLVPDKNQSSVGRFIIETYSSWSPIGVERFVNLTTYYQGCAIFRVIPNFVAQFGINPNIGHMPSIRDDPILDGISNERGTITFAKSNQPNTRSSQVYINTRNNKQLDSQGFTPIGRIIKGMDVVDRFYAGYGEAPNQNLIWNKGDPYLHKNFPKLSYIVQTQVLNPIN